MRKNHLPEIKQKNSFITDEFEMHKETFRSVHMANNKNWKYAKNFIWINKWQPFRWDMSRINFIIHNCTCTKLHELKPDKLLLTIYIQCKYHHWLAKYLPQLTGYFWHHYFHCHLMVKINTTWKHISVDQRFKTHRDQALFASFVWQKYILKLFWM